MECTMWKGSCRRFEGAEKCMKHFKPYPYQQACIDRIVEDSAVGLFLDCGLGKTAITLAAIKKLKYEMLAVNKVLVIAPKKVAESTWIAERDDWAELQCLRIVKVLGGEKQRLRALDETADIYLINRENVVWLVEHYRNAWPFDMVVIDESSSFKNHSAKRFKAMAKARPHINRIVELTGTPSPNNLMDLWTQIYLLDQGERLGKYFTRFREAFFRAGGMTSAGVAYNWIPRKHAQEDILNRISDICMSMKSEDYLQLPEIVYDDVSVELSNDARQKYDKFEKDMILELDETEITAMSAASLTGKLLQLSNGAVYDNDGQWQEIHICKLEALDELIERIGQPCIIYYQYKHDLERILSRHSEARVLKTDVDVHDWNAKKIDILLAHPASAGYGLNLQRGGHHIIWYGFTWNYEQYFQANKRLHRQGQKKPVIVHHLICQQTMDTDVLKALKKKKCGQDAVIDALKARIRKVRKQ